MMILYQLMEKMNESRLELKLKQLLKFLHVSSEIHNQHRHHSSHIENAMAPSPQTNDSIKLQVYWRIAINTDKEKIK